MHRQEKGGVAKVSFKLSFGNTPFFALLKISKLLINKKKARIENRTQLRAMVIEFNHKLITMTYFRAITPQLFYSFPLQAEESAKIDALLDLLELSGVEKFLMPPNSDGNVGRPAYDNFALFAAILLAFAIGRASLREIESSCRNDLRFLYVLNGETPSYSKVSRFIQDIITPNCEQIFACITTAIFERCQLNMNTVFLDGTKIQAKPNKYKFVWKPITFHIRLSEKVRSLLKQLGLGNGVPEEGILKSSFVINKLKACDSIDPQSLVGGEKTLKKMTQTLAEYLLKLSEYEEKESICGESRNSYYKTDHDATAMCLKSDYYSGLGSNMHAAYSEQLLVSYGFVVSYVVSQERSDLKCFQTALQNFHQLYNRYPQNVVADSGYGSLSNYEFCETNKIKAFVKYQSWNGEKSGRNPAVYEYLDDGTILCLGGRIGNAVDIPGRHPKKAFARFYQVKGCSGCEFMPYCRRFMTEKVADEKIFEIQPRYVMLKQKARDLLLSREGIEMRINRSCQVEGVFGIIKQNMTFTRFRRTSLKRVSTEFALTCLGMNIRKFMRYQLTKQHSHYWVAPLDLEAEVFKKPSAKRLANRVNKRREKQPNQIAKNSYKRKNKGVHKT